MSGKFINSSSPPESPFWMRQLEKGARQLRHCPLSPSSTTSAPVQQPRLFASTWRSSWFLTFLNSDSMVCFSSESKAQIKTFFWIPFQRWILSLCIPWLGMKMQPRNICKPREYWNDSLLAQSALNPWQKRSLKDEGTLRNMAEKTLWFWEKDLSESNFKNFDGAWK